MYFAVNFTPLLEMKLLKNILITLILLLPFITGAVEIDRNLRSLELSSENMEVILDPDRLYDIDNLPVEDFNYLDQNTLNFGFYDGAVWVRLEINAPKRYYHILELTNPYLDHVTVFLKKGDYYFQEYETGDFFEFGHRADNHRFYHFPLTGPNKIIIRIDNAGDQFSVPINIFSENALNERDYNEQFILGTYYGIILFVLIFNLFIYMRLKTLPNFYYVLYLFGLIILQLGLGGHGFQYIWSGCPYAANHILPIMSTVAVLFLLLFVQTFLNLKHYLPRINKVLKAVFGILLINVVLSFLPISWAYKTSVIAVNVITLILNLAIIPISILVIRQHFKPARYFFLAFSLLFVCVFIFLLRNFGVVGTNFLTQYSLQIGSAIEVILLSFAIVDRFKMYKEEAFIQLQEKNQLIEQQTVILEKQVSERTKELSQKSELLATKNKEVLDSINYAVRIQESVFPDKENFENTLNAFVYFEPKDIVSGDFYWFTEQKEKSVFVLADCTGHGVPGAMISILGINTLRSAYNQKKELTPAETLKFTNKQFKNSLVKENAPSIRDGMDISICELNEARTQLTFAGANMSLYLVRNKELIEFKGDRNPIGALNVEFEYNNHTIPVEKNDLVYLFSDGYPDQFGGIKNKKLKYKKFKEILLKISNLELEEQHKEIQAFMKNWKGKNEQIDDMTIIGVKI